MGSPVIRATIQVKGINRSAVTDEQGKFTIPQAPVGSVELEIDGSTTSRSGEWPTLSQQIITVSKMALLIGHLSRARILYL